MHDLDSTAAPPQDDTVPAAARERIQIVDILRGFALGGILIANMADFTSPFYYIPLSALWPGIPDTLVLAFIQIFVTGNFFTIFSFLFGLGLALQMLRLEARGIRFVPLYLRRQGILLCIGIAHGALIWYGDILAPYALFGCLLLVFRHRRPKHLVLLAAGLVLVPVAVSIVRMMLSPGSFTAASGNAAADPVAWDTAQRVIAVYAGGSWMDIFRQRLGELMTNYNGWIGRSYGTTVFAMFLLGLAAGRTNIFNNIEQYIPLTRKLWYIGLICVCVSAAWTVASYAFDAGSPAGDRIFYQFIKVGHIFICFFYIASVILLARRRQWKKFLSFFAAPGRMALTNYLLQSIVFTTIFNSYGLGIFGTVSPLAGLALSVLFFSGQVMMSNWMLSRCNFGPAEWLWKSATYGKRQPFVRAR